VQIQCIVTKLLCIKFFESLLHNIDLCQLEVAERPIQIGWCSGEIWNECFQVIFTSHFLELKVNNYNEIIFIMNIKKAVSLVYNYFINKEYSSRLH
jgi:hypothetical protein